MSEESEEGIGYMNLSDQAISAIMMAMQEGVLNQKDITDMLRNFSLVEGEDGLVVNNPPRVRFEDDEEDEVSLEGDEEESDDDVIVDPD